MAGIALTCSSRDSPDSSSGRSISSYFLDSLVHVFFMSFTEVGCLGAAGVYSWHWYCRCWCWCAGSGLSADVDHLRGPTGAATSSAGLAGSPCEKLCLGTY
ncbi:hypothetical protein JYU34_004835 [Plutella xylostella]|uniref:Uncharacterized protein n=1 Tax=Plutella xylostella TaxID=51655 RepID=A0ABQ7QVA6_PLUXY|nr:hypothetical protein JYU34_004835 [Plutella xylostella]